MGGTGAYDVKTVPSAEVKAIQASWAVAYHWPSAVNAQFDVLIAAESAQFRTFTYNFSSAEARLSIVIGAGRSTNGTVDMSFVMVSGAGTSIQQHYTTDKSVSCSATHEVIPPSGCHTTPYSCGTGTLPPCVCSLNSHNSHLQTYAFKRTCTQVLSGSGQTDYVTGYFSPESIVRCDSSGCYSTPNIGRAEVNIPDCFTEAARESCNKPFTPAQHVDIETTLSVAARPQLPAQANLLAASLHLPLPYPKIVARVV